jgi:phosphopantetheine--protein transferase-like protein
VEAAVRRQAEGLREPTDKGIGVDSAFISGMRSSLSNEDFLQRNFTEQEISYCRAKPDPIASFAGRWAAKEAVIKAISNAAPYRENLWQGAAAPLKDIEIIPSPSGAPQVVLHDHADKVAQSLGVTIINVSITHDGDTATAVVNVR